MTDISGCDADTCGYSEASEDIAAASVKSMNRSEGQRQIARETHVAHEQSTHVIASPNQTDELAVNRETT